MKFKLTLLLVVFIFFQKNTNAQTDALKGLDATIEQVIKDWNVPGVAVGIVQDGKIIYTKGFGKRNVADNLSVDENTLFAIGSCTKAFTAATAAIAVDESTLALDKPIKNYFPTFKMYDEYVGQHITLRDLLSHRSGLPRHDLVWYGSDKSRKQLIEAIEHLEPTADFRTTWQYQNLMYMTAGHLVGQQNNMTWEAYTQSRLLKPLGMNTTNFSVEAIQKSKNYALPYNVKKEEVIAIPFRNINAIGPAGSINSSAKEMANWLLFQLNKGVFDGKKIISESNFKQMHQPQMPMSGDIDSDEIFYRSYGMGWMLTSYRGHFRSEHGGNIDGFSANVGLLPRDNIGVVVLTNMNGTPVPSIIRNIVFDKLLGLEAIDWNARLLKNKNKSKDLEKELDESQSDPLQKKNTSPSHSVADYVGEYVHPAYGKLEVKAIDNALTMFNRGEELPLEHYHYDIFRIKSEVSVVNGMKVNFSMNENGDIEGIKMQLQQGVESIHFQKRINIKNLDLNLYTGNFELMGQSIQFFMENNELKLNVPPQPIYTLVPTGEHTFSIKDAEGFTIIFKVEKGKIVNSVTFNQPNGTFTAKKKP
jgi:CubicO group peptidase (beta-lactamase class C family)